MAAKWTFYLSFNPLDQTKDDIIRQHISKKKLLLLFLESELSSLSVWCNPLNDIGHGHPPTFMGTVEKTMTNDVSFHIIILFLFCIITFVPVLLS